MANAFVAVADDATAALWNPAGLVQLERPELSVVGSFDALSERFDSSDSQFESEHHDSALSLNFLSVVYPFHIGGRNFSVSAAYQRRYEFFRDVQVESVSLPVESRGALSQMQRARNSGGLSTYSFALAGELTETLSLGLTLNLWRSSPLGANDLERSFVNQQDSEFTGSTSLLTLSQEFEDVKGENVILGMLWRPAEQWQIGVKYEFAFTADTRFTFQDDITLNGVPTLSNEDFSESREMRFPWTIAAGVSFRANDRLTTSLDLSVTDWNEFYYDEGPDRGGRRISLVDGSDLSDPATSEDFARTVTVRLGAEYVFVPDRPNERLKQLWTVRGGAFYDQEPASGDPDDFYGVTAGVGLWLRQRVNFDVAYQFRFGRGVNKDIAPGIPDFEEDVSQHRILASAVIYF